MLTKPLYLEIDKPNYVPIYTVQYDYNSRFYEITILNNSQPLDLTGIRVIVAGKKPDGKEVFNSCKVLDAKKGLIQLELTEQMNAVNGASEYALELFSADGMLSSQPFKLIVTRSTISKSVESSKELGALKDALNEVQDIDNRFAQTNAQLSTKASEADLATERARIDNILGLPHGSTTGDAELSDMRIGANGETYSSAGSAVRTQFNDKLNKSEFDLGFGYKPSIQDGYYATSNGAHNEATTFKCTQQLRLTQIPKITGAKAHSIVVWNENTFIASYDLVDNNVESKNIPSFTRLAINFQNAYNPNGYDEIQLYFDNEFHHLKNNQIKFESSLNDLNGRVNDVKLDVDKLKGRVDDILKNEIVFDDISFSIEKGYITTNGVFTQHDAWKTTEYISLNDDDEYYYSTDVKNNSVGVPYFYDSNKEYLGYTQISDGNSELKLVDKTQFTQAKYFRITYQNSCKIVKKIYNETSSKHLCIPIYGQSNAKGYSAYPAISNDPKYPTFVFNENQCTLTESLPPDSNVARTVESSCTSTCEDLAKRFFTDGDYNFKLYSFKGGYGGAPILNLMKGTGSYNSVISNIKSLNDTLALKGDKLVVPVICYIQGENECDNLLEWKANAIQMQNDFENDIQSITGQSEPVYFCIYNLGWLPTGEKNYSYAHMNVCTAQMELVRDNEKFIMSAPSYALEYNSWDQIHLSNVGQNLLGVYQGHAIYETIKNRKFIGVCPKEITVNRNTITIKYHVPKAPLKFDEKIISKVDNYGFNVVSQSNEELINSVRIGDDNESVIIECKSSPNGCKLRYGCNGTTNTGRNTGCRGNLRDSQGDFEYKTILGVVHEIHNWGLMFEKIL